MRARGASVVGLVVLAGAAAACSRGSSEGASPAGSSSAAAAPSGSGAGAASAGHASAAASGSSGASPAGGSGVASSSWSGTYRSAAAVIGVPSAWGKVHWSDTKSTEGLGDGKLTLVIDGTTGRVTGTLDGPLGPAELDGAAADGKVSATLERKDPADKGFRGTLLGTVSADKLEGSIQASPGTGGVVRTATFALAPAPGH